MDLPIQKENFVPLEEMNSFFVYEQTAYKDIPMNELLDIWLEFKKSRIKISSWAHYRRVVEKNLKPRFEGKTTGSLTRDDILKTADSLLQKYAVSSTANIMTITNQIIQFMCDNDYVFKSPKAHIRLPSQIKPRPKVFTLKEQKEILRYLSIDRNLTKMGLTLCLFTGLRIGELCGLQWRDIDFDSGIIRINRTVQRISDGSGPTYFIAGTPKTVHSEREIPIPIFLANLIQPFESDKTDYVLSGKKKFIQPRTCENRYKKMLRDCGIPERKFHTLRHTFATRAIELGFDPKSLSEILGHSNVKTTLDLYVHPSVEQKKKEMERFSAIF